MTASASPAPGAGIDWADDSTALGWASEDRMTGLLDLPRRLAVAIAAADLSEVGRVVDVGSGPGDFLAVALDRCPRAQGTWIDVSAGMEPLARARLGDLAGRVEFEVTTLDHLSAVVPAGSADLIITSRVTHHLDGGALAAFYRQAAVALRPGGWLANLDHVTVGEPWSGRLQQARAEFVQPNPSGHRHDHPLPTAAQHAEALDAAGFSDVDMPWRAFWSVLFLARNHGPVRKNSDLDHVGDLSRAADLSQEDQEGQTR